jgi:putative addiction module component (TIGR02574 family)
MPQEVAELLKNALSLPVEARATLIDYLLESLDAQVDPGAEEAWRGEVHMRLQQIDSGAVKMIPWDDARRSLWAQLPA